MSCLPTYKGIRYKSTNDLFKSIKLSDLSDEQKIILGINKYDWNQNVNTETNNQFTQEDTVIIKSPEFKEFAEKELTLNPDKSVEEILEYFKICKKRQ